LAIFARKDGGILKMLKAGFIGFGRMGITHFSILNTHPSVRVVAICDPSKTMLSILKKYLKVKLYSDYQEMIDGVALDFVVVSTPVDSHSEIIKVAIDRNLHTFTEKPFALSIADGLETLAHLKGKMLVNQVGYVNRFNEVFIQVKRLLNAGVIGEVKNFSSEMYGATVLKDSKTTWRGRRKSGGGCMYEFASHCIDLLIYLIGKPDRVAGSVMQSIYSSDVEDMVSSMLMYKNGCSGHIMVNWSDETFRRPTNVITIFGTRGKIIADRHAFKIFLKKDNQDNGFQKGWNTRYITDLGQSVRYYVRGNEFTRQLDYFVDCIERKRSDNISSFTEALKTDVIMEEIAKDTARSMQEDQYKDSIKPSKNNSGTKAFLWKRFRKKRTRYV
jgi:predicted dehydrogenase